MGKRRLAMLVVALSCVLAPAAMVGSAAAGPFTIGPLNLISGPNGDCEPRPACTFMHACEA